MGSYMDLLTELKKDQDTAKRGKGRVVFLSLKSEIEAALNEGYSAREVWAFLHKKGHVEFQYTAFMNYVNKFIYHAKKKPASSQKADVAKNVTKNTIERINAKHHEVKQSPDTRPKLEPFDAEKSNERNDLI